MVRNYPCVTQRAQPEHLSIPISLIGICRILPASDILAFVLKNAVQLIAYVDRLSGGGFRQLQALLEGPLQGLFGGAHLLPFFHTIDGSDAGFDPIDHTLTDARLGSWEDVTALSFVTELMADLIVNHVSSESPQFADLWKRGRESPYDGLFLTLDDVFPQGAREADLLRIYRPRPGLPFTAILLANGERRLFWTTFTPKQLDINVQHPQASAYLEAILMEFKKAGIKSIRLDAAGYAIKQAGSSCFMIPETYQFIADLAAQAKNLGIEALVEIHSHYLEQIEIARRVDRVYDFALPPLILHGLFKGTARYLKNWLEISPRNAVTVLDTHDGIGVIDAGADAQGRPGLLPPAAIDELVETIHSRSNGASRQATGGAASNLDLYQVNCTFYEALGRRDTEYLIARALQFFAPGIPQVYYVGLLAGENDLALLARTGVGRDINRHYYAPGEVEKNLQRPVVQGLMQLMRFRNSHAAFGGDFRATSTADHLLSLAWEKDESWTRLDVDFAAPSASISHSSATGPQRFLIGLPQ